MQKMEGQSENFFKTRYTSNKSGVPQMSPDIFSLPSIKKG